MKLELAHIGIETNGKTRDTTATLYMDGNQIAYINMRMGNIHIQAITKSNDKKLEEAREYLKTQFPSYKLETWFITELEIVLNAMLEDTKAL